MCFKMKTMTEFKNAKSITEYFMKVFKDSHNQTRELFPVDPENEAHHVFIDQAGLMRLSDSGFDIYKNCPDTFGHPCRCFPDLIYYDPEKANEVWMHRRRM